jgi:hypothetical protein
MRTLAVVLCAAFCAALAGCGSIGEPLYPALKLPSRVTDLAVLERGAKLDFNFSIAPLTTEGMPLEEIGGVELRAGPSPAGGWNLEEWLKGSTRVDIATPEKPGPVHAEMPAAGFVGHEIVVAVRVTNPKGHDAGWSDFKTFAVAQPLSTPADLHVEATAKGVALNWQAAGISEFRVFRKGPQDARPAVLATATEQNYVDISAEYGKTYQYSVQSVRGGVESEIAGPESITPIDKFPPAVPSGLTASVGLATVELAWSRNTESDFKEYQVLRAEESGPFAVIARGLEAPAYSDRGVQSGKRYRYQVLAVDQTGNASAPCAPVEVVAP